MFYSLPLLFLMAMWALAIYKQYLKIKQMQGGVGMSNDLVISHLKQEIKMLKERIEVLEKR